jgi:hypothetical protein
MTTVVPGDVIDTGTATIHVSEVYPLPTAPGWAEVTGRANGERVETTRRVCLDIVQVVKEATVPDPMIGVPPDPGAMATCPLGITA